MVFSVWLRDEYRQEGESVTRATRRLAAHLEMAWTAVWRALKGTRLQPWNAEKIERCSKGVVSAESLTSAPTRREKAAKVASLEAARRRRKRARRAVGQKLASGISR